MSIQLKAAADGLTGSILVGTTEVMKFKPNAGAVEFSHGNSATPFMTVEANGYTKFPNTVQATAIRSDTSVLIPGASNGYRGISIRDNNNVNPLAEFYRDFNTGDMLLATYTSAGVNSYISRFTPAGTHFMNAWGSEGTCTLYNASLGNVGIVWQAGNSANPGVNNAEFYRSNSTGDITITTKQNDGNAPVSFNFKLNGTASNAAGGPWVAHSDIRKKNVQGEFTIGLSAILDLQPMTYELKDMPGTTHIGVIAQDVESTELASYTLTKDDEDFFVYNGNATTYAMINAIKELSAKLDAALARIEQLETAV